MGLSMAENLRILLVDDNEDFLEVLSMDIEDLGFPTVTALSVDEAFQKLGTTHVDIIVSDLHMEGKSGMDFIFELRDKKNLIPFIFLTGAATKTVAVEALRNGAFDLLEKPIEPEELARVLRSAGKLVNSIKADSQTQVVQETDDPRIVNLRSSARAFDDLARDSGIESKPAAAFVIDAPSGSHAGEAESESQASPMLDGNFEAAANNIKVKTLIDDLLKRNETAIDQLDNGQFAKTSLSFLSRSYNVVRENAEQINDSMLGAACETASSCFSFYRVNPKSLNKNSVILFKKYNEYLRELNKYGSKVVKKYHTIVTSVQELERVLDDTAA
jgi:CheY-like chemotaxis protein